MVKKEDDIMTYFFAGIKGTGMSALASMLHDLGNDIIGYDDNSKYSFTEEELVKRNIPIYYDLNNLKTDMIFVYTSAIHSDHKAVIKANELGLKMYEYFELLGEFTKNYETYCISGCHGKTTTTALLSKIFTDSKYGCNYLIGDGRGFIDKDSDIFIVESCEYKRHFLNYFPKYIVITNIELDHIDYYKDLDDYISAFQEFIDKKCEKVIACGDDLNVRKLKGNNITYYGLNDNNDIVAKNLVLDDKGSQFDCYINSTFFGHFDIPLYGKHMVLDALACIALSNLKGITPKEIEASMCNFEGAKRRFKEEKIGNNILIDDYAHHPSEVKVTLLAAKQKYPDKELVAILKIHTLSRAKEMKDDFIDALNIADKVYVMDIYNDREDPNDYPGVDHNLIINGCKNAEYINEDMADKLLCHTNSVICFLSSKDIYFLMEKYKELLRR
ncbi:MAG TPA: UDP-N-acetylmuramate--L-alanine ligase [Bacilli bacterium]|nr:UDP-N-acetylmuramate--L-alanine ligase [Bacilli bacterium]